jgi:hypothetical protein
MYVFYPCEIKIDTLSDECDIKKTKKLLNKCHTVRIWNSTDEFI